MPTDGLREIVGAEHLATGSTSYAIDGVIPEWVVRPGSYDELASVLRYASDHDLGVIPVGGPTHAALGNIPERYDIALETSRLDAIVEFEPADLTITCQAGITLGALRKATEAVGMMVPFDPSLPDEGTVGGVLAGNVSGPARISLGTPRDFTIGLRVATADGKLTRAGGKVVKNVAGYDLCKLYVGSLGTLCVIVEATFKTVPLPKATAQLTYTLRTPENACRISNEALRRGLSLRSALIARAGDGYALEMEIAGAPAAVERTRNEIGALVGSPTATGAIAPPSGSTRVRLAVRPSDLSALLKEAETALPNAAIEALPTVGLCRISGDGVGVIEGADSLATWFGIPCVVERCAPEWKRTIDVFGEEPQAIGLMRRIKEQYDPRRTLSPGRFVGRL
jgi:glycolate oxidase FAD binding subunit